jgi:hypothetical protein
MFVSLKDEQGISMVELVVVAAMIVVVLGAVLGVWDVLLNNYLYQSDHVRAQDTARSGMIIMVKDIREAEKPFVAVDVSGNSLVFKADRNNDGTAEAIWYYLDSVNRRVVKAVNSNGSTDFTTTPRTTAIEYVANNPTSQPLFIFYGNDLSTPLGGSVTVSNIRVVKIQLFIDTNTARPPKAVELSSNVQLRNFIL